MTAQTTEGLQTLRLELAAASQRLRAINPRATDLPGALDELLPRLEPGGTFDAGDVYTLLQALKCSLTFAPAPKTEDELLRPGRQVTVTPAGGRQDTSYTREVLTVLAVNGAQVQVARERRMYDHDVLVLLRDDFNFHPADTFLCIPEDVCPINLN